MEQQGIRCIGFNPFRPVLSVIMNNRDHRKIAVVDGKIAYTGGFNLADEYINAKEKFGYWKDAGIRLTGDCVWSFTSMFLEMWDYIAGEESDCGHYLEPCNVQPEPITEEKAGFVQPYSDSPLDREDVGENVYLHLINHAKDYVYIFTPYLILGSEMRTALCNAAKCGVDVRIVVPAIPDKKMVYLLAQSEFPYLIKSGVKIYKYTPGFIHSKCFVVDDVYATVGTVNLDYRSLYLHFECGTCLYRAEAVMQVKEDALRTFEASHEVTLDECLSRRWIVRVFMGVLRLFAPLL
jgi:cardiolipin synthase